MSDLETERKAKAADKELQKRGCLEASSVGKKIKAKADFKKRCSEMPQPQLDARTVQQYRKPCDSRANHSSKVVTV